MEMQWTGEIADKPVKPCLSSKYWYKEHLQTFERNVQKNGYGKIELSQNGTQSTNRQIYFKLILVTAEFLHGMGVEYLERYNIFGPLCWHIYIDLLITPIAAQGIEGDDSVNKAVKNIEIILLAQNFIKLHLDWSTAVFLSRWRLQKLPDRLCEN